MSWHWWLLIAFLITPEVIHLILYICAKKRYSDLMQIRSDEFISVSLAFCIPGVNWILIFMFSKRFSEWTTNFIQKAQNLNPDKLVSIKEHVLFDILTTDAGFSSQEAKDLFDELIKRSDSVS